MHLYGSGGGRFENLWCLEDDDLILMAVWLLWSAGISSSSGLVRIFWHLLLESMAWSLTHGTSLF